MNSEPHATATSKILLFLRQQKGNVILHNLTSQVDKNYKPNPKWFVKTARIDAIVKHVLIAGLLAFTLIAQAGTPSFGNFIWLIILFFMPFWTFYIIAYVLFNIDKSCTFVITPNGIRREILWRKPRFLKWKEVKGVETTMVSRNLTTTIEPFVERSFSSFGFRYFLNFANKEAFEFLSALAETLLVEKFDLATKTLLSLHETGKQNFEKQTSVKRKDQTDYLAKAYEALAFGSLKKAKRFLKRHAEGADKTPNELIQLSFVLEDPFSTDYCLKALEENNKNNLARFYLAETYMRPVSKIGALAVKSFYRKDLRTKALQEAKKLFTELLEDKDYGEEAKKTN